MCSNGIPLGGWTEVERVVVVVAVREELREQSA